MNPITSIDMYARSSIGSGKTEPLCPFLEKLDEEEAEVQAEEEKKIDTQTCNEAYSISLIAGVSLAAVGILFGGMIATIAIADGLVIGATTVAGGIAAAGIGYVTNGFGVAKNWAVDRLEINRYRAQRLADKIRRIAAKLLVVKEFEQQQLEQASCFFKERLEQYKAVTPRSTPEKR